VTGATGFIGAHVVRTLVEGGHRVTALVRASSSRESIEKMGAQIALGDMEDTDSLVRAIGDVDVVFHLATVLKVPWKTEFRTVNIGGTAALAKACADRATPPALVIVSSLAAGGISPPDRPRTERDPSKPISRYGRMKLDSEQAAVAFAKQVPITIVRPPMVLGDGDRWAVPLFKSVARGTHVTPTLRDHRVSLVHVRDLATAIVTAGMWGERVGDDTGMYYVAADERPTYAELGAMIARAMGLPPPRVVRSPALATGVLAFFGEVVARIRDQPTMLNMDKWREATAGSWICDATKARGELGWTPAPLIERLGETGRAYREAGLV